MVYTLIKGNLCTFEQVCVLLVGLLTPLAADNHI